jgi:3-oxoacyl-[acyl-carrier-protein] synthase II
MSHRVAVTGIGVVSSAGIGKEAFFKSCSNGRTGFKKCSLFPTEKLSTGFFGEVEGSFPPPCENPGEESRVKALMRPAIDEMMSDSGLDRAAMASYGLDARLCFGTLVAMTDGVSSYVFQGKPRGVLEHVHDYLPWISVLCGVEGGSYVSSSACASGTTAAGMAFDFIRNGLCEICVVGGADPLTEAVAAGFHSLKSLSGGVCNPYDESRDGISIGEGAAFFIFERLEDALSRGAHIHGEILGYGLTNEAYHITAPDPSGDAMAEAMKEALGGRDPAYVGHVNGHGTGTAANDRTELDAIERVFGGKKRVGVSSVKSIIGHCMGAAGALSLAAVLLAVENGVYMPLPNLSRPLETGVHISSEGHPRETAFALSNSFAFAGHIASVLVGRYDG